MTTAGSRTGPAASRWTAVLLAVLVLLTAAAALVWWNVVHAPRALSAPPAASSAPPTPTAGPTSTPPAVTPTAATPGPATKTSEATPDDSLPRAAAALDDRQIVWRHGVGSSWTMSTIGSDGSAGDVVLGSGEQDIGPHITHDRRTVLFTRREKPSTRSSVHAVAVDGSDQRFLFRDGTKRCPYLRSIVPSPEGRTLAVVCKADLEGSSYSLLIVRFDGSVVETLDEGLIGAPTFSPDGDRLVYPKASSGSWQRGGSLYLVPSDGSGDPRKILDGRNSAPSWAPVGDLLTFSRFDDDDTAQILTARVGGSATHVKQLTSSDGVATDPSWSPDGGSIVFRRGPDEEHYRLVVMTSSGKDERELSRTGTVGAPSWTSS